jgi:hypothetical protein
MDVQPPVQVWPGSGPGAADGPNHLAYFNPIPLIHVDAAEVNHNAEHPLAVVDADGVAVELKPFGQATD